MNQQTPLFLVRCAAGTTYPAYSARHRVPWGGGVRAQRLGAPSCRVNDTEQAAE